jgi:hypothetical protein
MARISRAVSIVTRYKYHQTRNIHHHVQQPTGGDAVDEGEIINAFWATYIIDKKWATALNVPSVFPNESTDAGRVETPWPLDMAQYETVRNLYISHCIVPSHDFSSNCLCSGPAAAIWSAHG